MRKNTPRSTNKKPIISIITPMYNAEEFISKSIESVLKQSFKSWEMIIIDDFSSDNSTSIVNRYIAQDSRIKLIKSKENFGGPAKPRNLGIKNAKGSFIAFLDCDDYWSTDKLKICVNSFNSQVDLIYHDLQKTYFKRNNNKKKLLKSRKLIKPIFNDLLLNGNIIANSSVIVRKNLILNVGMFDESKKLIAAEDYNLWLRISSLTEKFLYIPKSLGYYCERYDSISNKNMSLSTRFAVEEFFTSLNKSQKIRLEAKLQYIDSRFNFLKTNYNGLKKNLLFVIKYGAVKYKLRALIMLLKILINLRIKS